MPGHAPVVAPARRLMQMFTGIASARDMAPFDSAPLRTRVPTVDPEGRKVAYFHGCFGGYQDVEGEGRAAVELLEALGCAVAIPKQECCGIAAITYGANPEKSGTRTAPSQATA